MIQYFSFFYDYNAETFLDMLSYVFACLKPNNFTDNLWEGFVFPFEMLLDVINAFDSLVFYESLLWG